MIHVLCFSSLSRFSLISTTSCLDFVSSLAVAILYAQVVLNILKGALLVGVALL